MRTLVCHALLVCAALLASAQQHVTITLDPTQQPGTVTGFLKVDSVSIAVAPGVATVNALGTQQFTANITNSTNTAVTWQATAGTVSSSGLFTAPNTTAQLTVVVTATSVADATQHATATVTVLPIVVPPPPPPPPTTSGDDNAYCGPGNVVVGLQDDGPAHKLQRCMYTPLAATPAPGKTWVVTNLTDLNAALAGVQCGDRIVANNGVQLGGTTGLTVTLPQRNCDDQHWMWFITAGALSAAFPGEGAQLTPCFANTPSLPNRTYPCAAPQQLTAQIASPLAAPAVNVVGDHWRVMGWEITRITKPGLVYMLVNVATTAHHTVIDRNWIHGVNQDGHFPLTVATDTATTRGIWLSQSNSVAIINNWLTDFYDNSATSGQTDSQCIGGGVGSTPNTNWGNYKWVNNHCEGAGENFMLGGGGGPPLTPAGCTRGLNCNQDVVTDVEIRRNDFFKSTGWNCNTTVPCGVGWPVEKNGGELKMGVRVLLEGNRTDNTWYMAQPGYAIDFASKNQAGGCPTCVVGDVTLRNHFAYNVSYGLAFYNSMDSNCTGTCNSLGAFNVSIHDVLISGLTLGNLTGRSTGDAQEYTANVGSPMQNVSIHNITETKAVRSFAIWGADAVGLMQNWAYQNSIMPNGNYGLAGMHTGTSSCDNNLWTPVAILTACINPLLFDHNVIMNASQPQWPAGNFITRTTSTGGTAPITPADVQFTNWANGASSNPLDYKLVCPGSPYCNAGTNGKDLGADVTAISNAIKGVQ